MIRKYVIFLFTLLYQIVAFAQLGPGGGGIIIKCFIDNDNNVVDAYENKDIEIHIYGMSPCFDTVYQEINSFLAKYYGDSLVATFPHLITQGYGEKRFESQRLLIKYKRDTMLVDFHNILYRNIPWHVDHIDTLRIRQGHFACDEQFKKEPLSVKMMDEYADLSFLNWKYLPASYFIEQARYMVRRKDTTDVIRYLETAKQKLNNTFSSDIEFIYANYHILRKQYKEAIGHLSIVMNCRENQYDSTIINKKIMRNGLCYIRLLDRQIKLC